MSDHVHDALRAAAAKGDQVRGGCDLCDAYQTLEQVDDGIWSLVIHHDGDCPIWRAMNAGAN